MSEAGAVTPPTPVEHPAKSSSPPRIIIVAALAALAAFVVVQARSLWSEWRSLREEMAVVRRGAVIGYPNIHPNPSYAVRPDDWIHDDGEFTLLWSGWIPKRGHQWFKVKRGEIDGAKISQPLGRDVIQAIDYPIVETGGGTIWKKIPDEALVVGQELAGVQAVYPVQVLDKVGVINDLVADHPYLVTIHPFAPKQKSVHIYEPILDGHRVTMGLTGYLIDRKPVLYDRGTESLWVADDSGTLNAIGGRHRGAQFKQVAGPSAVSWLDWRTRYPQSRLVIGAARSKAKPEL